MENIFNTNRTITGRQIAFFSAFVLPVYKLLETPSLLASFMQGDLLLPAILHFLFQSLLLVSLLYFLSHLEKPLFVFLEEKFGKATRILYALYALYFLFYAILPLLDLEKFVYSAFFDTAPTFFSFAFFFILSAFVCTKSIHSLARFADLSLFLFLIPFLILLFMSISQAEISNLLPFFEKDFSKTTSAFAYTAPHFSDFLLLFPLLSSYSYQKKDALKITIGYGVGALLTLIFFAVFYGIYSTLAPREHYAFLKIAQYFPALSVIGRVDLIFIYILCVVLFIFVCAPLLFSVDFTARLFPKKRKTVISALVHVSAFIFVLFCNQYYNTFYRVISSKLYFIFWIFSIAPLLLLPFILPKPTKKGVKKHG